MKFNLKNRPKVGRIDRLPDGSDYEKWFVGFEKELRESLAYHDKMIDHWEHKVTEKHPLYRYREQIAGEWCVARGILTAVLGEEPKIEEETKR